MIPGRIGCELAVVAVLCVLIIFLFPSMPMQGPYSVVHGPATALLAARAAVRVRALIMQGAFRCLASGLISSLVVLSWTSIAEGVFCPLLLPERSSILRC